MMEMSLGLRMEMSLGLRMEIFFSLRMEMFLGLLLMTGACGSSDSHQDSSRTLSISHGEGEPSMTVEVEGSKIGFKLSNSGGMEVLSGHLGTSIPEVAGSPSVHGDCPGGETICLSWPGLASLTVVQEASCFNIQWTVASLQVAEDCMELGSAHWYGGPEELVQRFPIDSTSSRPRVPYLPGDMIQDASQYFGGVAEPFWVTSLGGGVWVGQEQPLWYSWNNQGDGRLCLSVEHRKPYMAVGSPLSLQYSLCAREDPKDMFLYAAGTLWPLPNGIPDSGMMTYPVWSTWAEYKQDINQSVVLDFAHSIKEQGFRASQVEVDDNWEQCYGDATFDLVKFPDPAGMVREVQALGSRVTLWIHPFINQECTSFREAAREEFLVRDQQAGPGLGQGDQGSWLPGMTWWWAGQWAGYVDFTNPRAAAWWRDRLMALRQNTGLDSFKFDAGEAKWLPSSYVLSPDYSVSSWPGVFSSQYVATCAQFGPLVEVRTGRHSQHLAVWVRMLDKYSTWGLDNGLRSMVTTLLQFGLVGYPFVLPDMVGGNGYAEGRPSRELYIRWLQVNVFMPALQISFVPWGYDSAVVAHALSLTRLHESHAPTILALAQQATQDGSPINRPVWWIDPTDQVALGVEDQFLLGDDILVAPVLEEGAVARDIYLPLGLWRDQEAREWLGPVWLTDYPAPLFTLPYFTRQQI